MEALLNKTPIVIVTRKLPETVETRMGELFNVKLNDADQPMDREALAQAMQEADVLVPTVTDRINADLIDRAGPKLKLIANFGNGVDNIDVTAAHAKGIVVTNTPNVLNEDTADMTMALILATPRRLVEGASHLLGENEWSGWSPTWMLGRRIWGKRLGIIGMGRIGVAVARRAKAFGLSIHYHNREPIDDSTHKELDATHWDSLDQMLAHMDIVSVNCPYTPATYHLLSERRLELLQPHAFVVNTARGEIIDENALIRLLEENKIAGAGLDVFEGEPKVNPRLSKLAKDGRVVLLPHMSSATIEGRIEMGEKIIINIRMMASGDRPPDRVLPSMI
ncbi:D-glycerate dehydrogenase [Ahrensia sp. 13_GOM-1096m]|uniref:2-hydroxyacid dehydrogenase n=1 Tax=Ahrensia sp. 13_GOM-1096m TaxID=1380380 RepID=UPI00047B31F2|nr:D-glycerate dehydrogenase [Ahrensia sp. 13_GOM-1096m]